MYVFMFRNLKGKIKSYKENIYVHSDKQKQFMVTEAPQIL